MKQISAKTGDKRAPVFLIVDDTCCRKEKSTRKMEGLSFQHAHEAGKTVWCHCLVTTCGCCRGSYAWDYRPYYSETVCQAQRLPNPEPSGDRAVLTITLTTGIEKEFDLSIEEVNAFLKWYDTQDAGLGPVKFAIDKHTNKGPFAKRTEYVIFDKILTFEVSEYSTKK